MDIEEANKIIKQQLDSYNAVNERLNQAGAPRAENLSLDAAQRAFFIGLLRRYSREPITTREERQSSELGVILASANIVALGPNVIGGNFTRAELDEAVKDMIFIAMTGYLECRQVLIKDLKQKTKEVLALAQVAAASANAGGFSGRH